MIAQTINSGSKLNIVFFGTSEFAEPILESLIADRLSPIAVVTEPDKPAGRGGKLVSSPIKLLAQKYNFQIMQPEKVSEIHSKLRTMNPELMIVAAYGQILAKEILDIPRYSCLNIHPSILPKYRGPSPIQSAILAGDKTTGITIIKMDKKMDHGPIVAQESSDILPDETTTSLSKKLSALGTKLLIKTIPKYINGRLKPTSQDDKKATYTKLIKKEDGKINWNKPAEIIEREIRAYYPWPGSYTYWKFKVQSSKFKVKRLKITEAGALDIRNNQPGYVYLTEDKRLAVSCSQGSLEIKKLQLEGKKEMISQEFLNGYPNIINSVLK